MPLSAYSTFKVWLGIAKVTTDGTIADSGGIASGAVTVHNSAITGTPTSSMSVIFLDGPNTETCALSAYNSGTGAATIAATTYAHPQGCYMVFQTTSSLGPTAYIPVKSTFEFPDKYDQLYDESYRNQVAIPAGVVQGLREGDWSIGGDAYGDSIGWPLGGIFGAEDFTSGTPNTHLFAANNSGSGSNTDKYMFFAYDSLNTRLAVGRFSEVGLKIDSKAVITWDAKLLAHASGIVGNPTVSFSSIPRLASWASALTLAGTYNRRPQNMEFTFSREESENIATFNGTQDMYDNFTGPLKIVGKGEAVKVDDALWSDYQAGTQIALLLSYAFGSGATALGLAVQLTSANLDTVVPKVTGKSYLTEEFSFTGLTNSTDANTSGGGLSPGRVTLTNAVGTGVYV